MAQYVVTHNGETASPLFQSVGQAEDFRDLMLSYFKTYLPAQFVIELDSHMRFENELAEANVIIEGLEDDLRQFTAENRRIRQTLADLCLDLRTRLDKV
jgi:hypothetical protein